MPPDAMAQGGGGDPNELGAQLQEALGQAMILVKQIGPQMFTQISGPILRGFFAEVDKELAPLRNQAQQGQMGGMQPQAGPPPGPPMA